MRTTLTLLATAVPAVPAARARARRWGWWQRTSWCTPRASTTTTRTPLPVFLWDECFSTFEARGRAATATHGVDAVAAAVILEEFFDADCRDCECVDAPEAAAAAAAAAAANDAAAASLPAVESASEKRRRLMAEARQQEEDLRGPDG